MLSKVFQILDDLFIFNLGCGRVWDGRISALDMPTFLFWNINRQDLSNTIGELVHEHDVDVLILAEAELDNADLLTELNVSGSTYFSAESLCKKVRAWTRFPSEYMSPLDEGDRFSIRKLSLPARQDILLATAHLPSKLRSSEKSQQHECRRLARRICEAEQRVGHSRTLFMGDVNVNPFEDGIVEASGFHGVMTKSIASKGSRVIQGETYRFFYNPMWSHFGERAGGPPGTFYYRKAESILFFWNIFDQVLIRPELAEKFRNEDLHILTRTKNMSFMNEQGQPDFKNVSDHLPILLKLDF